MPIRSILAADFGSVYTRIVLFDVVDGEYRFVARAEGRTTDGFPVFDMEVGFVRLVRQISRSIGRPLLDETDQVITPENENQAGVDLFALTASIGRPLRAVVIGLVPEISLQSAIRATYGTYINVNATISLADDRDEEERLNAILLSYPDLILLAGGTDGGATAAIRRNAEVARLAVSLIDKARRPLVVYAGNNETAGEIQELFEPLTTVFIAQNVRPELMDEELEPARLQLGRAFDRYKETRQKSFAAISERSQTGILSTAQAQTVLTAYLGRLDPGGVGLLDAGSAAMTVAWAQGKDIRSGTRSELGLGTSAPEMLDMIGPDAVRVWLPFAVRDADIRNYALNKSLRPGAIPMSLRDLHMEHAFLRAGLRHLMAELDSQWPGKAPPVARLITGGSALTRTGSAGYDALLALDVFQPKGVVMLETDPFGLLPAMGALATQAPEATVQLLEGTNLNRLGVAFCVDGSMRPGQAALTVKLSAEDGETLTLDIEGGRIMTIPLLLGEQVQVEIRCKRGVKLNGKRRLKFTVEGGSLGLIFDTRGRPIPLGETPAERAEQIPRWIQSATGDPLQEIPPAWLTLEPETMDDIETPELDTEDDDAPTGRRGLFGRRRKPKPGKDDTPAEDTPEDDEVDELGALRDVLS
jgi:hypothetical protein